MRSRPWIAIVLGATAVALVQPPPVHGGDRKKGKLDQFEDAIAKKDSGDSKEGEDADDVESCWEGDDHECTDACRHRSAWDAMVEDMLVEAFYQLFVGTVEELRQGSLNRGYAAHPYEDPRFGRFTEDPGPRFAADFSGYYLYNNPDLDGFGFRGHVSPVPLLRLEFQFNEFHERLDEGSDRLALYNLMVNFNRVRSPNFNLWWGLGIKGLHGDRSYTGFAYDVGMEIYPVRPVSLQLVHTGGWLNGVYVPEFFGTLNVHVGRVALMAGYQLWTARSARLDGLVLGVKVHL